MSTKSKHRSSLLNVGGNLRSSVDSFKGRFGFKQSSQSEHDFKKSAFSYGEEVAVIPGRESHTSNLREFEAYIKKIEALKHTLNHKTTASEKFWNYVRSILEMGFPVGFEGDPEATAVVPKGPDDYHRYLDKLTNTEIINPINPVTISDISGVPISDVLTEMLFATDVGMVTMKWAPFCERCGAAICTMNWVEKLPIKSFCQGCRYENTIECLSKIKVFFVLSQDVFYILSDNFPCTASQSVVEATEVGIHIPATSSGSGWRVFVGCGGDMEYRQKLAPGLYRMHCPIVPTQNYLRVKRDANDEDEPFNLQIQHSKLVVRPGDRLRTLTVPHGKVQFDIFPDTKSEWIFWIHKDMNEENVFYLPPGEREHSLTAFEVLEYPTFRLLFEDKVDTMIYDAVSQMEMNEK